MELIPNARIPDGLLATMMLLSEKPHQGVPSWESAPHQGIGFVISSTAMDFQFRCSGIVSGTVVAPSTYTKVPLPGNALTCTTSTGVTFNAPPNFNVFLPYENGEDNGVLGSRSAVGQGGTYDYQRPQGEPRVFIGGYTPVANIAVGAYQYGAGQPAWLGSLISNGYASLFSKNGPTAQQAQFRQVGRDLASGKATYSCRPHQ